MKIFITGVSSGIGKSLAEILVEKGHEVFGIARREEILEEMLTKLENKNFYAKKCDLENLEEMENVFKEMEGINFIPDIIILNAAVFLETNNDLDFNIYKKTFDINVLGSAFWVYKFLPYFLKRGDGAFIAISSVSAIRQGAGPAAYSASKAALSLTFKRMRSKFSKTNVKFSTIYFGPVDTPMWQGPRIPFIVPSATKAATYAIKIMSKKSGDYYFPFFTTFISRASVFFPEKLFNLALKLIKPQKKR